MAGHGDDAGVLDVDLGVGALGDALDGAAAGADHGADQFRIDAEAEQARGMGRHGVAGLVERLEHLLEDVQTGRAGLIDGLTDGLHGQTGDLHVHLQGGDALLGAGHLEVHVAEEVLDALMSVSTRTSLPSRIKPMAAPATGAAIGTPASISARVLPQTEPMEVEPLELSTQTPRAPRKGTIPWRQHGDQGPLSQSAVADLAATGGAHRPGFTHRVGEVVVVQVVLLVGRVEVVHLLGIRRVPRVAVESTWVRPRWNTPEPCTRLGSTPAAALDRTHLIEAAAIDALAVFDDLGAHH